MNPSVQNKNPVQAWATTIHCRLGTRHNHETNRDKEILVICININATESCTDIPDCRITEEIRTTIDDGHLGILSDLVLFVWPLTKAEEQKELKHY